MKHKETSPHRGHSEQVPRKLPISIPGWDAANPAASFRSFADYVHGMAKQVLLKEGHHSEMFFFMPLLLASRRAEQRALLRRRFLRGSHLALGVQGIGIPHAGIVPRRQPPALTLPLVGIV